MSTSVQRLGELGRGIVRIRRSSVGRQSLENAIFSIADYVAQPIGMVLAAPFLVHCLGVQQYGVWMLVSAVVGSMGLLAMGFGDATIKYVSKYHGMDDLCGVRRTIRATLGLNLILGGTFGSIVYCGASYATLHLFKIEPALQAATLWALRISALVVFVRSLEIVFASSSRAYEKYGPTVKINILVRAAVIVASVILAAFGLGVVAIMTATLLLAILGAAAQMLSLRRLLGCLIVLPVFDKTSFREISSFGLFSWFQAFAALLLLQADRLIVGALLGTSAVAYYTICVQASQPIHGLIASAFSFLFPRMSSSIERGQTDGMTRVFRISVLANIAAVIFLFAPVALFAKPLLRLWMGPTIAASSHSVLSVLSISYALLALSVVPHYTLLGLGKVRFVTATNVIGGLVSLGASICLIPLIGLIGASIARLLYGVVVSINFAGAYRALSVVSGNGLWSDWPVKASVSV